MLYFKYYLFQYLRVGVLLLLPAGLQLFIIQGPATYPYDQLHHLPVLHDHHLPARRSDAVAAAVILPLLQTYPSPLTISFNLLHHLVNLFNFKAMTFRNLELSNSHLLSTQNSLCFKTSSTFVFVNPILMTKYP